MKMKLFYIGAYKELGQQIYLQTVLINRIAIIQCIFYLFFSIVSFVYDKSFWNWFPNLFGSIWAAIPLYLNYKNRYKLSLGFTIFCYSIYIVFCVFIWGIGKNTQLYLLPICFIPIAASGNSNKITVISVLLTFSCFIVIVLFNKYLEPVYMNHSWPLIKKLNSVALFICSFLLMKVTLAENTELRKEVNSKNKELKMAIDTKDLIYSVVAHDIKNPISITKSLMKILTSNKKLSENYKNDITRSVDSNINSTHDLVLNLLIWAKSQSEKLVLNIKHYFLYPIVNSVVKDFFTEAKLKNIKIQNLIPKHSKIRCDYQTLEVVIRNVISNALNHTPNNSTIEIGLDSTDIFSIIFIQDEGKGISEDSKIPYTDRKLNNKKQNPIYMGLGLKICIDFMELNSGKFEILNNSKGCICKLYFQK